MNINWYITIPHSKWYFNITALKKVWDNLWQWDGCNVTEKRIQKNGEITWWDFNEMELKDWYKYHTLSQKWLKSYINTMEDIFFSWDTEEIEYSKKIAWNKSQIDIKVLWHFYGKWYRIDFRIKNKFRKEWKWVQSAKKDAEMKWEIYDPKWHGTDEKYVWVNLMVTPEHLKQYILDLVEEYERETGEKYEFKYNSLKPWFLTKLKSLLK